MFTWSGRWQKRCVVTQAIAKPPYPTTYITFIIITEVCKIYKYVVQCTFYIPFTIHQFQHCSKCIMYNVKMVIQHFVDRTVSKRNKMKMHCIAASRLMNVSPPEMIKSNFVLKISLFLWFKSKMRHTVNRFERPNWVNGCRKSFIKHGRFRREKYDGIQAHVGMNAEHCILHTLCSIG